jgi:hypothetical protein
VALQYRVYQNDSAGGPVDYGTVVATVAGLTWDSAPLPPTSDTTFAVRAFDPVAGLEEKNVDARVRIRLDAAGVDVSGMPNAPIGLGARATGGGGATATWLYNPGAQGGRPAGFRVYVGSPAVSYASPALSVPYSSGRPTFFGRLAGLAPGDYQLAVRAYNAAGEEANTAVVALAIPAGGPLPVEDLAAAPL